MKVSRQLVEFKYLLTSILLQKGFALEEGLITLDNMFENKSKCTCRPSYALNCVARRFKNIDGKIEVN